MTAELVRGQNHPLPDTRLELRVSAGHPVVAGATLADEGGRVAGAEWIAHPGAPVRPGVEVPGEAAAEHRIAVDLAALPDAVHRLSLLLALPQGGDGPARFGTAAAPFVTVADPAGAAVATYTITGLDRESAVVALELYRRQGAWKVRAVGQGYEGGLADLLADQGAPAAADLAAAVLHAAAPAAPVPPPLVPETAPADPSSSTTTISYAHPGRRPAAPAAGPGAVPPPSEPPAVSPSASSAASPSASPGESRPVPVAGDASGWSMDERLYNQVWGMFEDLARSVAAYRSARDFADHRLDRAVDQVLADPSARVGGAGDAARAAARATHEELMGRAQEVLDRDLAQLTAESEVVEPALPVAYARWDNPVWHAYRTPEEPPMAVRLGDLHVPEQSALRIPFLVRLPLERGLWVDSGPGRTSAAGLLDEAELRRLALDSAVAHTARLLAAHPAGALTVHVLDPAGGGAAAFAPLVETGVLTAPPARGAAGVTDVLAQLTERVDLLQMAVRGDASEDLPPGFDPARQLLVVHDFPHGFDDRAVTRLRYLADEGPSVGVHLLMVADRADAAAYGPVLDPLWRSLLRLTPVPDDHLADPWVGHAWTYEPPTVPPGSAVLWQVLGQVGEARRRNSG
ncbi:TerD family protein [Streptomyces sp. R302]|uniref:TerD family protein n=1 Tax=unclassified Streptomyces TaxID=2593676 RepID=UPI00145F7FCE|nr:MULTISPECIES: TerD family protein [unclassified Streptomyces]NML49740.1 TerD family protein [Streptomyces sp. R301]NML78067.1 TerD family protein [Streptomyces sp. R302]